MKQPDRDFLIWIADRLVHVYGESPNVDFVQKLRKLAKPRFHVEGQTSTLGAIWQIWDGTKHQSVLRGIPSERVANTMCAFMNDEMADQ